VNRKLHLAPVAGRRRTERTSGSRPGDFKLGKTQSISHSQVPAGFAPYCFDFLRRRSLYVGGLDLEELRKAPFYYLYARRNARSVLSVPWEHGALSPSPGAKDPILIFSPGRVGSTLLCSILDEANVVSLSEPDFYSQATLPLAAASPRFFRSQVVDAVAALSQDLSATFSNGDAPFVVKLRAECGHAPEMLLSRSQEKRSIFMLRDFDAWARSSVRTFKRKPSELVRRYVAGLRAYKKLRAIGPCHFVRYEDLIEKPDETCAALGRFLQVEIPPNAVQIALSKDSQRGTPLERGNRQDPEDAAVRLAEALRLWRQRRSEFAELLPA